MFSFLIPILLCSLYFNELLICLFSQRRIEWSWNENVIGKKGQSKKQQKKPNKNKKNGKKIGATPHECENE